VEVEDLVGRGRQLVAGAEITDHPVDGVEPAPGDLTALAVHGDEDGGVPDEERRHRPRLPPRDRPAQADGAAQPAARRRSGGTCVGGRRRSGRAESSSAVTAAIRATASSNTASVAVEVFWTPLTLRTYWRAAASISSGVASG